jgi:2-polyprenyl-3-methyl-5-hydroxy-6-metoxy-1,4-benzoquinol methylase
MPAWTDRLLSFVRRNIFRSKRERWNHKYRKGNCEGYKDDAEVPRLDAVARMLCKHKTRPRVLEMGSGEALLQRRLTADDYARWLGVDLSDVVIEKAQQFTGPQVDYQVANMLEFQTAERFDAILFTECINYVEQRDQVLRRYFPFLAPQGVFILSVYEQVRSPKIWMEVDSVLDTIETVVTENERGKWICKVMRPRS